MTQSSNNNNRHRYSLRVDDELDEALRYWSKKLKVSVNDFVTDAVLHYIAYQNKDYDLPTLEAQRLNQLIDSMAVLSSNVASLERIVTSGFDSLISLTRGDNMYLDDDDGELDSND